MKLTKNIQNRIKKHADQVFPEECCGLIVKRDEDNKMIVKKCKNMAEDKINNFQISVEDYLNSYMNGEISAVYHSHTQGQNSFSEADKTITDGLELANVLYITKS